MTAYVNAGNIPLSLAVFLATDNYDYDHDPNTISATQLIKPLRQLILADRVPKEMALQDITDMVQIRMGTAIHDSIEKAWKKNYRQAMEALGYPKKVIERVKVNPDPNTLQPGDIPVYLEQRSVREIMGFRISGKFDFVGDGRLEDFKSTSVYSWIKGNNDEKYILQGSIYRWLRPDIITQDEMAIQFIFTDWSKGRIYEPNYPPHRTMQRIYKLKSLQETQTYITSKLSQYIRYRDLPEEEIPPCSDEDLWRTEPQFKYYKNPEKTQRATKNFDNYPEAHARYMQDGQVGRIVEVPGKVTACKYCPAFPVCNQKDHLIATGELDL